MSTDAPPRPPSFATARAEWAAMLALAWPALVQQSLLFAVLTTDQLLARPYSEEYKAALTAANYVYWFIGSYAVVVTAGATAVVGRLVGERDFVTANRAAGQALWLALGFGLVATLLSFFALDRLVGVLGLSGEEGDIAARYLRPLVAMLPVYLVEVVGIACLVGAGDTRTGRNVLLAVALVNGPVAYCLSRGAFGLPEMGFLGISYGTAAAHTVGAILVLVTLRRGRFGLHLRKRNLRPRPELLRRLLRVSLPAAADSISMGVFQLAFFNVVAHLGPTALSAHGIALRVEGLGYLTGVAFATATAAVVARQLGAGRPDLAGRGARTALVMGGVVMSGMGAFFCVFARPLFELFAPPQTPGSDEVIRAGVPALRLIAFAMPGLAGTIILTQALRAAGIRACRCCSPGWGFWACACRRRTT